MNMNMNMKMKMKKFILWKLAQVHTASFCVTRVKLRRPNYSKNLVLYFVVLTNWDLLFSHPRFESSATRLEP